MARLTDPEKAIIIKALTTMSNCLEANPDFPKFSEDTHWVNYDNFILTLSTQEADHFKSAYRKMLYGKK